MPTPEERHLADQRRILDELAEELANREVEFAALGAELAQFRRRYIQRFGPLYAQLDSIEAKIAQLLAELEPSPQSAERAAEARARADQSMSLEVDGSPPDAGATATPGMKEAFRRAARMFHPDLAIDEDERRRRTKLMADANDAYRRGDQATIERLIEEEATRPEAIVGDDVASELVRVIRKSAQIRRRIEEIDRLEAALKSDELWDLFAQAQDAIARGDDLLLELEANLNSQLGSAHAQLAALLLRQRQNRAPA